LLGDASEPLYYSIGIDIDRSTDNSILNSRIKLANNAPNLSLAELNPDFVAIFLSPFTPPHQWPDSWKKKAKEDDLYSGGGFFIKFNEKGRLLFVGICSHCENQREYPIVVTPDGKSHYTLPLTIKQFSDVFGLPTRKYKVNEIRY
jgi:hypothetical protein